MFQFWMNTSALLSKFSVYILYVHIRRVNLALEATQQAESNPESVTG